MLSVPRVAPCRHPLCHKCKLSSRKRPLLRRSESVYRYFSVFAIIKFLTSLFVIPSTFFTFKYGYLFYGWKNKFLQLKKENKLTMNNSEYLEALKKEILFNIYLLHSSVKLLL